MLANVRRWRFGTAKKPNLFIKSGTVVNHDSKFDADIQIVDGKIVKMAPTGLLQPLVGSKIINATNKFVIPGGIETHSHLQMPFMGAVS